MSNLDWLLEPTPEVCPAPLDMPDWYRDLTRGADLLPPLPDPPPPPPTKEAALAAAIAAALAITTKITDEDDCEDCEPCLAVLNGTGGIPPPPRNPYPNQRINRVGYEYQHYVVNWFFHDPVNRIIMEWQFGGVWFDGLDPKEGTMLYGRGIARAEYDPGAVSTCYLIDTKYGYDSWVRYDAWDERWVPDKPPFLIEPLTKEIERQYKVVSPNHPNVMLVWIFSGSKFKEFCDTEWIIPRATAMASVYYAYIAEEDK